MYIEYCLWAQVAVLHILDCLGQVNAGFIQVLYLGRAPRTKETLPEFLKWRRVTRHPLVFRRLTGSQRTPGKWGVTSSAPERILPLSEAPTHAEEHNSRL